MLIKKAEALSKALGINCTVLEYNGNNEVLSIAKSIINGRLPENGMLINKVCEETYFVISGKGKVFSEKGEFDINEGDVYHFEKGKKYYVWGEDLELVIANSPKWYPEQFEII